MRHSPPLVAGLSLALTVALAPTAGAVREGTVVTAPAPVLTVAPNPFSPNGDDTRDKTNIRVRLNERASLSVEVRTKDDTVVRDWSVPERDPGTEEITWNGKVSGSVVADGRYRVRVTATDPEGLTGHATSPLIVDTRPPKVAVLGSAPNPLVSQRKIRFDYRVRDRARELTLILEVEDAVGSIGKQKYRRDVGKGSVRWRARYQGGGALYPGNYGTVLQARDDAGNVGTSRRLPWRVHRPKGVQVYRRLEGAGARVALTFDDCHFSGAWKRILSALRSHKVKATFFCPGRMILANAGLARRTVRQGHTLAAHAWDHANLSGRSPGETARRLAADARAAWSKARVTTAPYFRPPYGAYDRNVLAGARSVAHPRVMMWDVDTLDWQRPGTGAIIRRAVGGARRGSVILMHTLDQTAAGVPAMIRGLRRKGLEPVSLPELFRAAGKR